MTINNTTRPENNNINTRVNFDNSFFNVAINREDDRNDNFITIELKNKSNENIYIGHKKKYNLMRCFLN